VFYRYTRAFKSVRKDLNSILGWFMTHVNAVSRNTPYGGTRMGIFQKIIDGFRPIPTVEEEALWLF